MIIDLKGKVTCEGCDKDFEVLVPVEIKPDRSYCIKQPNLRGGHAVRHFRHDDELQFFCKECFERSFPCGE